MQMTSTFTESIGKKEDLNVVPDSDAHTPERIKTSFTNKVGAYMPT